ncbi:hypothetical protein GCM10017562_75870 [Streptomyces roseofulvus]
MHTRGKPGPSSYQPRLSAGPFTWENKGRTYQGHGRTHHGARTHQPHPVRLVQATRNPYGQAEREGRGGPVVLLPERAGHRASPAHAISARAVPDPTRVRRGVGPRGAAGAGSVVVLAGEE